MLFELPDSLPVLHPLRMQLAGFGKEVEVFRSLQKSADLYLRAKLSPGSLPAPSTPFFSKAAISSKSRSAARISGSISFRNALISSVVILS
jgi:hypothetical protein